MSNLRPPRRIIFRIHAIQRMFERGIDEADVRAVLITGEVIEDYPADTPYPSCLLLGWRGIRPLHLVLQRDFHYNETFDSFGFGPCF
jgi:hypothetical protein